MASTPFSLKTVSIFSIIALLVGSLLRIYLITSVRFISDNSCWL